MHGLSDLPKVLANHRDPLSRLRLLRAATTLLATGQMPKLADPFGSDLLFRRETGKVKNLERRKRRRESGRQG